MRTLVQKLLRGYQRWVSPMFRPACRYVPTCSEYAMEAVERFGVLRGGMLAVARLMRCHPFARGGLDLVPAEPPCCTGGVSLARTCMLSPEGTERK